MNALFTELPLRSTLQEALSHHNYVTLTPIQSAALPLALSGRDVTGQAKTGSGKTAAFGLALLNQIDDTLAKTQALVLCPTRELADQVAAELRRLSQRMHRTRILTVCGGQPYHDQKMGLKKGCHVVVGTPGRVGNHLQKGHLEVEALSVLVLDEADRILDMGFIEQVTDIVQRCPNRRQTLLFSATFPKAMTRLCATIQTDAAFVSVDAQVDQAILQQQVVRCAPGVRNQTLVQVLAHHRPKQALVFCETRRDCESIARFLSDRGAVALPLHGQMEQRDRDDALLRFSNCSACILVATNVAARGIDIPSLPLVLIAELSPNPESHIHRIGRTGRAGAAGLAVSVVCGPAEETRLQRIEASTGVSMDEVPIPDASGGLGFMKPSVQTLLLLSGRKDKVRKGDVIGALVKDGGIPFEAIGHIVLTDRTCAVAIANAYAVQALRYVRNGRIKKKKVRAQLLG